MMQHDERLPEKTREFLRCTRITAKRLGNNRHDIIHCLLHRVPGPHSITWRTQRIIYEGPIARAVQREYHNKALADIAAVIADLQHSMSPKRWVINQTDQYNISANTIYTELTHHGLT